MFFQISAELCRSVVRCISVALVRLTLCLWAVLVSRMLSASKASLRKKKRKIGLKRKESKMLARVKLRHDRTHDSRLVTVVH